ncbi:MAG: alginate lyase family protein, partial [Candidatus Eisenbacteria bacterium]|nr:alginate lyase family protein [Candidatus Eisenbacteria bacterium]
MSSSASAASWKLRRLLAMTPPEIAVRALRGASNRVGRQRRLRSQREIVSAGAVLADPIGEGQVNAWLVHELSRGRCRLVRGAEDPVRLREALAELDVPVEVVVRAADGILDGRISAFGRTTIETGPEVDWLVDPVSGEHWPLAFWADVDYRRDRALGDPRYVWEVNRHHHLVTLARAYALTGESRYADRIWRDMVSWLNANPPLFGINWASPLEIAIRLISWAMAVDIVGADGAREGDAGAVIASVALQATHLSGNLSIYASSRNNHLIGEAAGLLVVGAKFPFLRSADTFARRGQSVFQREVAAQVTSDGVDREQALHYQSFVLEFAAVALTAVGCLGTSFAPEFRRGIECMCAFMSAVSGSAGVPPSVGDADGGRVYELSERHERQAMEAMSAASVGCDHAPPASHAPPDLAPALWLFGGEAVARSLTVSRPETVGRGARSSCYSEGGYFVPAGKDQHGVIDCGPLGYLSIAAHGHADCLSLVVCHRGKWILVDPGTCCYHREQGWRDYFRGTTAHNTVAVDRADQSEMLGPFMWGRRARAEQLVWSSRPRFDYFEGAHDGYRGLGGVRHRRSVLFGKRGYWIIVDRVEGSGRHTVESTLQLAAGFVRSRRNGLSFDAPDAGGVEIVNWLPEGLSTRVVEGSMEPKSGWV